MPVRVRLRFSVNGNGLNPVNCVLQREKLLHRQGNIKGEKRIVRCIPKIEKERAIRFQYSTNLAPPIGAPVQVLFMRLVIVVSAVCDSDVVRRGGDNNVNGFSVQLL